MKSVQRRVSKEYVDTLKEIHNLQRLPQNEETRLQISQEKTKLHGLSRSNPNESTENGPTSNEPSSVGPLRVWPLSDPLITFQAFHGTFSSGSKCITVYQQVEGNLYWNTWALITTFDEASAIDLWGADVRASHCGFFENEFKERDNGDYSGDFSPEELVALGITNDYKGFFAEVFGGNIITSDYVRVTPSEMIDNQRIVLYDYNTDEVLDYVNFDANSEPSFFSDWNFTALTLTVLVVALAYAYFSKKY